MLNVHYNGDLVHCPDIRAIRARNLEVQDNHRICRYNVHESKCAEWQPFWIQSGNKNLRCYLAEKCRRFQFLQSIAKKKKSFTITHEKYREMASASHYLIKNGNDIAGKMANEKLESLKQSVKKNGETTRTAARAIHRAKVLPLFLTLTFPPYKKKHKLTQSLLKNEIANQKFSMFIENIRRNYGCPGYVAVREISEKHTNRVHFHLLISLPFIPLPVLNDAWMACISDLCFYSRRALTSDPNTRIIRKATHAMRYVCKYFSKHKGASSDARLVFISNNLIREPERYYGSTEEILSGYQGIEIFKTSDYTTTYRIRDNYSFDRFCRDFLYKLFDNSG